MNTQAEHVKCVMEALEHGFTHDEIVDECLSCTGGPDVSDIRHENMGWLAPTCFSENL